MSHDREIHRILAEGCKTCDRDWEWRGLLPICPGCGDIPESHRPIGGSNPVYIQPPLFNNKLRIEEENGY